MHGSTAFVSIVALALFAGAGASPQTVSSHPSPVVSQALQSAPLLAGSAWYPEQWPESRWEQDIVLMEQAHLHVVRLAEFAWSTMEPSEGQFQFGWLDRAIALAAKHNIKVVLGTPTAAPPAWLTQKYPETLRMDEDGRRAEHGNRQHFSFTDPTYRRLSARIAAKMAEHYGHNPNVIGWQLDNELAAYSYDPSARAAFHAWLRHRYGSISELNRRWATAYWSQTYTSFDQVPVHSRNENPALLLDFRRFVTDTWISYCNNQIDAMRPFLAPAQWITTNTMHWNMGFDHYKLHTVLDLAAWDDYVPDGHYDPILNAASHDLVRGYKNQNFWLMETQPAFVNWSATNAALPPGVTREMAWQAVGHGADAVLYWQWRSAPNGQEEYHGTLLGADGTPVPVYREISQFASELERASDALRGTSPHAPIAIVQDFDSHWAIDFQRHSARFDYTQQILDLYHALAPGKDGGSPSIDLVSTSTALEPYKVVFAPALNVLPEAVAQHLIEYVRKGGTLVLGPRSGMKDGDNALQPKGQPGDLIPALGARVEQFYALASSVALEGGGTASAWAEPLVLLDPSTKVVRRFAPSTGWLSGEPAVVEHAYGKGRLLYIGGQLDLATLRALFLPLLDAANIHPLLSDQPAGIEIMERTAQGRLVWVVLNHEDHEQHVTLPHAMRDVLTDSAVKTTFDLPAHGAAVLVPESQR